MAYTYIALNLAFIAIVLVAFRRSIKKPTKTWWLTLGALLVMTAVFDNIMLMVGIFSYDTTKLLGLYVGAAPIEDFFYALLAAILMPILWQKYTPKVNNGGHNA